MQLCLMIEGQEGVTWEHWQAIAAACEQHSITALFRSDHYLSVAGDYPERGSLDAWGTIAALAAVTTRLRLGTMVSPVTFRHPSMLAKLVTTADHISNGRIELGLGAGWHEREHAAYGFPFPDTATRIEILEEQLRVVVGSWSESQFSLEGEHYRVRELQAQPKPVQQPHPPLIIGGMAGPRSCALAAHYADEYNTPFATAADVAQARARLARACEQAGRDPIPFSVMTTVIAGADQADLQTRAARIAEIRREPLEALLANPPLGSAIGTVEQVAEQLTGLREAGVSRVVCQHLAHEDLDFIELLGERIAPLLA